MKMHPDLPDLDDGLWGLYGRKKWMGLESTEKAADHLAVKETNNW